MTKCSLNIGKALFLGLLLWACGARDKEFIDDEDEGAPPDAGAAPDASASGPVRGLFGIVFPMTGLSEAQCKPEQMRRAVDAATGEQQERYFTGLYTTAQIERLRSMVLVSDSPHFSKLPFLPTALDDSPWNHLEHYAPPPAGTVCGLKIVSRPGEEPVRYALDTYESKAAAEADGARVTHQGNCGHCSSMLDLAALLSLPGRAEKMRKCALKELSGEGKVGVLNCVAQFALSEGCTMAWYYNSLQTRTACLSDCIYYAEAVHHLQDGSLNECMLCNNEKIDDVFNVIVGRRDHGQPISLCRELPEEEWICHNYADDFDDPEGCIGIGAPKQKWVCTLNDYDKAQENYDLSRCVQLNE